VPPIRTKDRVYLDVISESANNAVRLVLGWAARNSGHFVGIHDFERAIASPLQIASVVNPLCS